MRSSLCIKSFSLVFKKLFVYENLLINVLRQSNVSDAGRFVAQQVDVWIKDGRINGLTVLAKHCELEI